MYWNSTLAGRGTVPWLAGSLVMAGFLEEKGCFLRANMNLEIRRESAWECGSGRMASRLESFALCLEGLGLKDPLVWASEEVTCL